ncbi:MAG: SDH family Clp fold serine proteinase [Myxococcota bacterium]
MPTYSEIGASLGEVKPEDHLLWLSLNLRKVLAAMEEHTGRPVVLYEGNHRVPMPSQSAQMREKDLEFFMDVLKGLKSQGLDVIVNSYGGSPDAADMVGSYLRQKFDDIRVFVPVEAMSAATMLACGASSIVLGKHSFLGPIDLQMPFITTDGPRYCAAQDVLDQYEKMRDDFEEDADVFWEGPGARYWPDSLIRCENALSYGREVAERGLKEVMFRGCEDAEERAKEIAADLADHQKHRAHARRLSRTYVRDLGINVANLEDDDELQDLVLTIHHLCSHWFETFPGAAKVVQASHGRVAFDLDDRLYGSGIPDSMHKKIHRLLRELSQPDAGSEVSEDVGPKPGPDAS